MNNDQKLRQSLFNHISSYPQFREDRFFTPEYFCVYLANCFWLDGHAELSPKPNNVYNLLIDSIIEEFGAEKALKLVKKQKILNWKSELESFFPNKIQTLVHISALVVVADRWIYRIGHELMELPEPTRPTKYFSWVQEDWLAVYTLINNFHNQLWSTCKEIDKDSLDKNRFSVFESLYLSQEKNKTFEEAKDYLKKRNSALSYTKLKIKKAIEDEYYREAISLEENLIKNLIFNYLSNINKNPYGLNFYELIAKLITNTKNKKNVKLFKEINKWRKSRNECIHENINSGYDGELTNIESHEKILRITANEGLELCEKSIEWYKDESVSYINHEFPVTAPKNIH